MFAQPVHAIVTPLDDISLRAFITALVLGAAAVQTGVNIGTSVPVDYLKQVYNGNNWSYTTQTLANFQALETRINNAKTYGVDYIFQPSDYVDIGITNIATSINKTLESYVSLPTFTPAITGAPAQILFDNNIALANWDSYKAAGIPYRVKWQTYDCYSNPNINPNFVIPSLHDSMDSATQAYYKYPSVCTKISISLYQSGVWNNYAAWRVTTFTTDNVPYTKLMYSYNNANYNVINSPDAVIALNSKSSGASNTNVYTAWQTIKNYFISNGYFPTSSTVSGFTYSNVYDVSGTGYKEYVPSLVKGGLNTTSGIGTITIPGNVVLPKDWTLPTKDDGVVVLPTGDVVGSVAIPLPIPIPGTTTGDTTKDIPASAVIPLDPSISIPNAQDQIINKIKLPGFDNTIQKIKDMDTSRGDPPKITFDLNALFNAATSRFGVPQSPFASGQTTLIDFGMLQNYKFMGIPLIDYFRSVVSMGFIITTFFYVWRKITPSEVMGS